jgi:hypothetical protein
VRVAPPVESGKGNSGVKGRTIMNRFLGSTAVALILGVAGTSAGLAQQDSDQPPTGQNTQATAEGSQQTSDMPIIALTDWDYDEIYSNGWSLERLIDDARVFGAEGEEIGDIENVLIGEDGRILSIIAEVGGFLDIGDTHVSVPWDQLAFSPALDLIETPVNQENVEEYSVYGDWGYIMKSETGTVEVVNDDLLTGPRVWKATELLHDYALLTGSLAYGYVDDLIFTNDGMLHAVVVDPGTTYATGPVAYPFYGYGYGFTPVSPYYTLPYGADEIAVIDTFDEDRLSDDVAMEGTAEMQNEPATTGSVETGEEMQEDAATAEDTAN